MPRPTENIRKVACTMDGQQAQFLDLDQNELLVNIIEEICRNYQISNPGDYALQFTERPNQFFITERNRFAIRMGDVLKLALSPAKMSENILTTLQDPNKSKEAKFAALKELSEISVDTTFAQEFITKNGMQFVMSTIETGAYANMPEANAYMLRSFVELMDHGIVSWDVLETTFIRKVASEVQLQPPAASTLQSALQILESIILHSTGKYPQVEQEVTPVNLLPFLQTSNSETQKNAIALINALFLKADSQKRRKIADDLQSKSIRNVILNHVLRGTIHIGAEMAHQLYVLQSLLFNLLEERRLTPVETNDQIAIRDISDLRKIAFDTDSHASPQTNRKHNYGKDHKKLGFQNYLNPAEDFGKVPPGVLALDCMLYFAKMHGVDYTKVVLENSSRADEHDLPFAQASIELANLLCEILKVGEPPTDEGSIFYPMFFTHDKPFEEFYCLCIQLLNKTWKDMKATAADLPKVLSVVKEQVTRGMESCPPSFDQFKSILSKLTYAEITKIWEKERRNKEEWESQAKPILELQEQIRPEILELVKHQRLNYLTEGTRFTKYHKGQRTKGFWYCRLAPNHKAFYHGDCDENSAPPIEMLPNKLTVVDIKGLVTGKDCPHINMKKQAAQASQAFSILVEPSHSPEPLNFIAPSSVEFQLWIDGINALLGNKMESEKAQQDLETLLSMEIRLRLLDTEGIKIPESPPPIPTDPPNYDFAY